MNQAYSVFDRRKVRHFDEPGHAHFLTFSCYRRMDLFRSAALRDAFIDHLGQSREKHRFRLYAWVIMPNHVHLVLSPAECASVSSVLLAIKRPFAQQVIRRWRELRASVLGKIVDARGGSHFWQAGPGYDYNIYSVDKLLEKVRYIHENPVRGGLVGRSEEWRWSSGGSDRLMVPDRW